MRGSMDESGTLNNYRKQGLGGRVGFGKRIAILVVDATVGFTDPTSPLGASFETEIAAIRVLLDVAREYALPIIFTTVVYEEDMGEAGIFALKVPSLRTLQRGTRWVELDPRLGRLPSEALIEKKFASCFYGTHLTSYLNFKGVDTLIVTGFTTSGCVRASVVDALQGGLRVIVPMECVGDRAAAPHQANLIDIEGKYGDVMPLEDVITAVRASP
jgi:maleamate amidohydrolase